MNFHANTHKRGVKFKRLYNDYFIVQDSLLALYV